MSKWPKEVQHPLCEQMNEQHNEVLLRIVKCLADQKDALAVKMIGVDGDGVRLIAYTMHGEERLVVPFRPPLSSYDQAQDRILQLATL